MSRKMYFTLLVGGAFVAAVEKEVKEKMFRFSPDWTSQVTILGTLYTCNSQKKKANRLASSFFEFEIWDDCYLEINETDKWDVIRILSECERLWKASKVLSKQS